jgi:pimeloyl-ACP methyl ester carboxylesterase
MLRIISRKEVTIDTEPAAREATLTLNRLRFHYRAWGNPQAPAVVLLHGYTSHARSWDTIAHALSDRCRVLALDQRGHGESDLASDYDEQRLVEDLAAFVDALGLERFAAVGFSIGGFAAASYAVLHPERVSRMVLAECFAKETSADAAAHIAALRALPTAYDGPKEMAAAQAAAAFRPLAPHASEEELRRWMVGGLAEGPDGRWSWRYDPVFRVPGAPGRLNPDPESFAERLAQVTCPMLLVVGDESFAKDGAEAMAPRNPRARLVVLPETGHWVPLDNPRGFLDAVREFLTEEG